MNEKSQIPKGFSLVPTGGRPKKTTRDITVYLAYLWKKEEVNTADPAIDFVIKKFSLTDDHGSVRKLIRKAKAALPKQFLIVVDGTMITIIKAPNRVVVSGAPGWSWHPELSEAVAIIAKNVHVTIHYRQ